MIVVLTSKIQAETDLISPNPFRQERNLIVAEFEYLNRYLFQVHRGEKQRQHSFSDGNVKKN